MAPKTTYYRLKGNSRASIGCGDGLVPHRCIRAAPHSLWSTEKNMRFSPKSVPLQWPYLGATGSLVAKKFFREPCIGLQVMVVESRPFEQQARRYTCRQMTRVLKIPIFPLLEPFANLQNWIGFPKFQTLYGSFFGAIHKNAVEIIFPDTSLFATLKRILRRHRRGLGGQDRSKEGGD